MGAATSTAAYVFQPTTFGNYFLTRRLAIGGMAEVYSAKLYGADGFEKDIVIKQILPQFARDPEFIQSFVAEAKIAVTLSHANIVGIYELGRVDKTYFIAMEYVEGLDVFALIDAAKRAGERISAGAATLIMEEAAKGLEYAHRKKGPDGAPLGLVHRDLSPRNVLISREGEVKILDFGIAKIRSDRNAMPKTRQGVVKGTTGYMSPEQATGGDIDARTDVYQAGLLLFELLTGEALFWRPDDLETRERMREHKILPPSELVAGIPSDLDRLLLAALARNPDHRIQSAADFGAELARVRLAHYPRITSRALGEQVARLFDLDAAAAELEAEELPTTLEIVDIRSDHTALPRTKGIVETIATRALDTPSRAEAAPSSRKSQKRGLGSSGIAIALGALALGTLGMIAASWKSPRRDFESLPLAQSNEGRRSKPRATIEVVVPTDWARDEDETRSSTIGAVTRHTPIPRETVLRSEPPVRTEPPTSLRAGPRPAHATVSFGAKQCSSRVTVDGVVLARSTPAWDLQLLAGNHRVTFDGTSCPLSERPGSLQRSAPRVDKQFSIKPGDSLKIIADFAQDTIAVTHR